MGFGAKGGIRTPTLVRAQRPERCVSTSSTTLASSARSLAGDSSYDTPRRGSCQVSDQVCVGGFRGLLLDIWGILRNGRAHARTPTNTGQTRDKHGTNTG